MSMILYYSNFCSNCSSILPTISQSQVKNDIHFLCIDNRIKKNDGSTYIVLQNQQEILLPSNVTQVPALMLINRGNQVIYGKNIMQHLQPVETDYNKRTQQVVEPEAFCFGDVNGFGVSSDNFSFLDQSVDSLSAKGNGGLRQLRNNVTLEYTDNIETPPDDYTPNKIGSSVTMEQLQNDRANAIK